jgi:CRP/FNR family transcriptional regulator, cyclic AMP receptor protein
VSVTSSRPVSWTLLELLTERERERLSDRMITRRYRRGEVVCNHGDVGDSLWVIASGRFDVQLTTPEGHVVVVRVLQPGEFFGELALVRPNSRRVGRVAALEPSVVHVLYRGDFEEVCRSHPRVERLLVAVLADRLEATNELIVELLRPAEVRIWRRLRVLANGTENGRGIRVSQEDLAHMSATTRQTVNRVLGAGEGAGVIRRARGCIDVVDAGALHRMAEGHDWCERAVNGLA